MLHSVARSFSDFLIISRMVYLLLYAFPDAFDDHADCQQHFSLGQNEIPAEQSTVSNSPSSHTLNVISVPS